MSRRAFPVSLLALALVPACLTPASEGDDPAAPDLAPGVGEARSALNAALPEAPALARDVAMFASTQYTHPTVPAFRTSADGRVALNLSSSLAPTPALEEPREATGRGGLPAGAPRRAG